MSKEDEKVLGEGKDPRVQKLTEFVKEQFGYDRYLLLAIDDDGNAIATGACQGKDMDAFCNLTDQVKKEAHDEVKEEIRDEVFEEGGDKETEDELHSIINEVDHEEDNNQGTGNTN